MKPSPDNCAFLTVEQVHQIHAEAIRRFGGSAGLRDLTLLESAVAAPQASFGGESVYEDVVEVAAAYLYYLCKNHPFIDGNKRVALGSCLVFLDLNGIATLPDGPAWQDLTLDVAASRIERAETTRRLRDLLAP